MLVCDFGMCTFGTFETATWGSVFYDIGTLWCCKNRIPKSSKANKIPGKILFMGAKVQIRPKVDFGLLGCSVAHSTQNRVLIPNMGWDSPNSACRPRYGPKKKFYVKFFCVSRLFSLWCTLIGIYKSI